ncbi:MAG: hypothetical protein ACTHMY_18040 [Solirubrobacteraceae bacterium]
MGNPTHAQLSLQAGPLPEDAEHGDRIAETLKFATDEQLALWLRAAESRSKGLERRLQQVENYCANQAAQAPSMVRECEQIRREHAAICQNIAAVRNQLEPRSKSTDGLKPAA